MNQFSKIYPKWGKKGYNLWGCESLKYQDPEIDRIAQSFGSYPKKITFKQIRKLKGIACRGCTHYITGQCPYSKEEIEQLVKKFKLLKPKCSVCSLPLSFHYFLFERNSPEQLCIICLEAKINGTLEERKKKTKRSKMPEILQLICMSVVLLLSTAEAFFDGVFDWGDYIFIGLFSFLFLFGLTYLLIKRKRKKKLEEES